MTNQFAAAGGLPFAFTGSPIRRNANAETSDFQMRRFKNETGFYAFLLVKGRKLAALEFVTFANRLYALCKQASGGTEQFLLEKNLSVPVGAELEDMSYSWGCDDAMEWDEKNRKEVPLKGLTESSFIKLWGDVQTLKLSMKVENVSASLTWTRSRPEALDISASCNAEKVKELYRKMFPVRWIKNSSLGYHVELGKEVCDAARRGQERHWTDKVGQGEFGTMNRALTLGRH